MHVLVVVIMFFVALVFDGVGVVVNIACMGMTMRGERVIHTYIHTNIHMYVYMYTRIMTHVSIHA